MFEKELQESLAESKTKEEEGTTQQALNSFDDFSLNKSSEHLIQIHPEIKDDDNKLKFNELYSFGTFKELYKNVKLLMNGSKSKEALLN
jgi:hypothetical protein